MMETHDIYQDLRKKIQFWKSNKNSKNCPIEMQRKLLQRVIELAKQQD